MNYKINTRKQRGFAFAEYAILIGLVAMVFVTMDMYIKRGIQARTKDITDFYLSPNGAPKQAVDQLLPNKTYTRDSSTDYDATSDLSMSTGGGTGVDVSSTMTSKTHSKTVDQDLYSGILPGNLLTFIPWESGDIQAPKSEDYTNPDHTTEETKYDWEIDDDIPRLQAEVDKLVTKAQMLEERAAMLDKTSGSVSSDANILSGNFFTSFFSAITSGTNSMNQTSSDLSNNASDLRRQAQEFRDRASQIEARIASLTQSTQVGA
ncbi:MAG: hypothetical protein PHO70_01095 [Candidatus Omnitrophica bacterium]|nr:hypothetical protein [Candidatus Omnitrophota bacterium]